MQGARLVNTPAMKRIGSAVIGLADNRCEIPEKSKFVPLRKTAKRKTTSLRLATHGLRPPV
jgi:hypothetical protein